MKDTHIWKEPPSLENVEMIFVVSDTMDDFSSYAVFAWDVLDNMHMLEDGKLQYMILDDSKRKEINEQLKSEGKPPVVTLEDLLMKDYLVKDGVGIKPTFMVIDQRRP